MTKQIMVGGVAVGGGAPVTIQSMCNTKTEDARATVEQILRLEQAGCEIVRVTVPTPEATAEFGDETALLPDGGRLLAVHLRACGRIGSSLKLYVRYDGESSWQLLGSVAGSGREELIRIPVPPRP